MNLGTILYTIILKPLYLLFEVIFNIAYQNINNLGFSIIVVSIFINFLILPLYNRAEQMQIEEKEIEDKLKKWVTHIKQTFHGDEKTMMLQMYYRQNKYSPLYALKSAAPLLLEIPFFIVAYRFLSNLELFAGSSFGLINDLARPDALLLIGSYSINVLPIIMTIINLVSSTIYSKDYSFKTKVQLYGMAVIFLIILYNSPSGLVLYWTINNVFSLIKTIYYKTDKTKLIVSIISAIFGILFIIWGINSFIFNKNNTSIFIITCAIFLFGPAINNVLNVILKKKYSCKEKNINKKNLLIAGLFLAILTGILIPSSVLRSSPQEFIELNYFVHPLWYLANSFLLTVGIFVLWPYIFYSSVSNKTKYIFECFMFLICGYSIINYLLFGTNLGTLSSNLIYDQEITFTNTQIFINTIVLLLISAGTIIIFIKKHKVFPKVLLVAILSFVFMSMINCFYIIKSTSEINVDNNVVEDSDPYFTLSSQGKNVVVIMLDRAMGEYGPYIFNEKPELKEQFSGFTYYSNTISFGGYTNFASPALFGGYEYTPIEMNKRDTELLVDKQNEALKVMPVLFDSNGFDVTVINPVYANYNWFSDVSIYDEYPSINKFTTRNYFITLENKKKAIENRNRNFFFYSMTKISPLLLQPCIYENGNYNQISFEPSEQIIDSISRAHGLDLEFMQCYNALQNMSSMTKINNNSKGSFLMMSNDITHDVMLLDEPSYEPKMVVDNTKYDEENKSRFIVDGKTLITKDAEQYAHYQSNMAALIKLGKWFDELKSLGVYDNTKIIIVSDHGRSLYQIEELIYDRNMELFYPLLMAKDFDSKDFSFSDEFMTNADVPTLATLDVIDNPINPFTSKLIDNIEKTSHDQFVIDSDKWNTETNNGTTFLPAKWYTVHDSIWKEKNWTVVADDAILPQDSK